MPRSRLKVGIDVPWVTSWSEEPILGAGPCATVLGRLALAQAERPGLGRPLYSKNHLRRQRQSVADMLCPMCGAPTPPGDRWTQLARRTRLAEVRAKAPDLALPTGLPPDLAVIDAGAIAPLHKACVDRSLAHCPHLRGHPGVEVMAFPDRWLVAPLMVQAVATAHAAPPPAIGFLQLLGVATAERRLRTGSPRPRRSPRDPARSFW